MSWIFQRLRQVKILNKRTNFGNILRHHLIKIKIKNNQCSCCAGCSLINKIKSSMKLHREPGMRYAIRNNKVFFSVFSTSGNTLKALRLSIIIITNSDCKWLERNYTSKNYAVLLVNKFLTHNSMTKLFVRHTISQKFREDA